MNVLTQIRGAGIVTIASHAVNVGAGGTEMNCDCPCHDPNLSGGRLCTICAKNYINCKKHGINKARENNCWCNHAKLNGCYRCHLEEYHCAEPMPTM